MFCYSNGTCFATASVVTYVLLKLLLRHMFSYSNDTCFATATVVNGARLTTIAVVTNVLLPPLDE